MAIPDPHHDGNPLARIIHRQIALDGPMSLSQYMRLCLTHPQYGYYKSRDPLGQNADFITSPEISQMFGEMIGNWIGLFWQSIGRPKPFILAEFGPGRGTLMADALRALKALPEIHDAMQLVLLETNETLRQLQKEKLAAYTPGFIHEISELERFNGPVILIANEFFDALPIRQYQWQSGKWFERLIGAKDDKLHWGLSSTPLDASVLPETLSPQMDGEIYEDAPLTASTLSQVLDILHRRGGGFLNIDYGYLTTQTGSTFQAVAKHQSVDPFADPGNADLTAHVNFDLFRQMADARNIEIGYLGTQGDLLAQLGINQRAKKLTQQNPERAQEINADLHRLIDSDQMGKLFKAIIMMKTPPAPHKKSALLSANPDISHGFFGRKGGVSQPPFDQLNVSFMTGDDAENVTSNRNLVADALGCDDQKLTTVKQVHSAKCVIVDESLEVHSSIEADAMVTRLPHVGLGILTADCTPILFFDPIAKVIGAAHAGWQGARDGIVKNTVEQMQTLGASPENIVAAIGPNIKMENYEVGAQFMADLIAIHPDATHCFDKPNNNDREHFDLTGFVTLQLAKAGISMIEEIEDCTYALQDTYFSHRFATHNEVKTGRQISVILRR